MLRHESRCVVELVRFEVVDVCRLFVFFFQAEDGIRDIGVTGVQTCALPISSPAKPLRRRLRLATRRLCVRSSGITPLRLRARDVWVGGRRPDDFRASTVQMSARLVAAGRSGRWGTVLAVAGLMLALFLVALDQTVVGTALPKIVAELNGFEHYAWVTTAYLLASTSMFPVIGKLGDVYGRKWFIVSGIVVFLIGSALSGAAWGMTELILFRGMQGLGAGMIFSNVDRKSVV